MSKAQLYGAFTKVQDLDDGTLYVEGIASSETRDQEVKSIKKYGKGELITADAVRAAIPAYLEWGCVREMHEAIAAGKAVSLEVRDDNRTYLAAHVVDEGSIKKVKANVLQGFSLGGDVTQRNKDDPTIIEGISLTEISLVDRPCNPDARITLVKMDGATPMADTDTAVETVAEVVAPVVEAAPAVEAAPVAHIEGKAFAPVTKAAKVTMAKGMEAFDALSAINILIAIENLITLEEGEGHEEAAAQLANLKAAVDNLKLFVASELQESDDSIVLAAGIGDLEKGDFPGHEFHGNQHTSGGGGGEHNEASAKAHESSKNAGKGASSKDHAKAAKNHAAAAKAHDKEGNSKTADYHRAMSNYHEKAGAKASKQEGKAVTHKSMDTGDLAKAHAGVIGKALKEHAASLEKCHKAIGEAHGELVKCHGDFSKLFGKPEDKPEGDDAKEKPEDKKDDTAEKVIETGDLAKRATDLEGALAQAGEALAQVVAENDELKKIAAARPKGVLRAVEKARDVGAALVQDDSEDLAKMAPESRARHDMCSVLKAGPRPL